MSNHSKNSPFAFPVMMSRLMVASWETIFHRTLMMSQGTCSSAEYQRMVSEKAAAMQLSAMALMTGRKPDRVLAPYVSRARSNAKRLRKKY
jgi:hypothetical protein